jgi:hypothetical protein
LKATAQHVFLRERQLFVSYLCSIFAAGMFLYVYGPTLGRICNIPRAYVTTVVAPVAPVAPEEWKEECVECIFMHFCPFGNSIGRSPKKTGSP